MKIVILAPTDRTFISDFIPNYAMDELPEGHPGAPWIGTIIKGLLDKRHTIVAVTTTLVENDDYNIKVFSNDNFTWVAVPRRKHTFRPNGKKPGMMVDFFSFERKQMLEVIKQHSPDIVHAFWSYEFAGAAIMSGLPCLVTIEDNAIKILSYFKNLYRFFRLLMSEWVLRRVRFASTVSPYMLNYAKKRCENVRVIPNPVPIISSADDITLLIDKRINNISSPKLIMVNNGWNSRKNGKNGLLAFKGLLQSFPNATLHLFGSGSEIDGKAFQDAKSIGLSRIHFNGPIAHDSLINELKTAHLFIHPALEESFGVVLIEAMAFGVPAIGGKNSGAVPWVIDNSELLVDVDTPEAISIKIKTLLNDLDLYKRVAMNCYNSTGNRFSADFVVNEYLDYYKYILNC